MKAKWLAVAVLTLFLGAQSALAKEAKPQQETAGVVSRSALIEFVMAGHTQTPDAADRRARLEQQLNLQDAIIDETARLKLLDRQDVRARIELGRREAIVASYWADFFQRNPITDSMLKSTYENLVKINGNHQYQLSQIVVKDESTAQTVMDELKQGATFADVAAKRSLDQATRAKGGELGWHWKSELAPFVAEKLDTAKSGDLIGPWRSNAGAELIVQFQGSREQAAPELDKIKSELENSLRRQAQQKELARLSHHS